MLPLYSSYLVWKGLQFSMNTNICSRKLLIRLFNSHLKFPDDRVELIRFVELILLETVPRIVAHRRIHLVYLALYLLHRFIQHLHQIFNLLYHFQCDFAVRACILDGPLSMTSEREFSELRTHTYLFYHQSEHGYHISNGGNGYESPDLVEHVQDVADRLKSLVYILFTLRFVLMEA